MLLFLYGMLGIDFQTRRRKVKYRKTTNKVEIVGVCVNIQNFRSFFKFWSHMASAQNFTSVTLMPFKTYEKILSVENRTERSYCPMSSAPRNYRIVLFKQLHLIVVRHIEKSSSSGRWNAVYLSMRWDMHVAKNHDVLHKLTHLPHRMTRIIKHTMNYLSQKMWKNGFIAKNTHKVECVFNVHAYPCICASLRTNFLEFPEYFK